MKKERMNNKGFSLVELIIVIAIMAVLVVVLAPQFLKYVERARVSTDKDNAAAIATALQVWAAAEGNPGTGDDATVTVGGTGGITLTAGSWAEDACNDAGIFAGDAEIQSRTASWGTAATSPGYTITMQTNGQLNYSNTDIVDPDYNPS